MKCAASWLTAGFEIALRRRSRIDREQLHADEPDLKRRCAKTACGSGGVDGGSTQGLSHRGARAHGRAGRRCRRRGGRRAASSRVHDRAAGAARADRSRASQLDRETMERVRAQIAEAQAYKNELELIYEAVKRSKAEIGVARRRCRLQGDARSRAPAANCRPSSPAPSGRRRRSCRRPRRSSRPPIRCPPRSRAGTTQGLAHDIQDRVVQIFEACNFQDLTGQRVAKVVATLKFIEEHVGAAAWKSGAASSDSSRSCSAQTARDETRLPQRSEAAGRSRPFHAGRHRRDVPLRQAQW